jgi:hypothetical protein
MLHAIRQARLRWGQDKRDCEITLPIADDCMQSEVSE